MRPLACHRHATRPLRPQTRRVSAPRPPRPTSRWGRIRRCLVTIRRRGALRGGCAARRLARCYQRHPRRLTACLRTRRLDPAAGDARRQRPAATSRAHPRLAAVPSVPPLRAPSSGARQREPRRNAQYNGKTVQKLLTSPGFAGPLQNLPRAVMPSAQMRPRQRATMGPAALGMGRGSWLSTADGMGGRGAHPLPTATGRARPAFSCVVAAPRTAPTVAWTEARRGLPQMLGRLLLAPRCEDHRQRLSGRAHAEPVARSRGARHADTRLGGCLSAPQRSTCMRRTSRRTGGDPAIANGPARVGQRVRLSGEVCAGGGDANRVQPPGAGGVGLA